MSFRDDLMELLTPTVRTSTDLPRLAASIEDLFVESYDCGVGRLRAELDQLRSELTEERAREALRRWAP